MGGQVLGEIVRTGPVHTPEAEVVPLRSHIPPEEGAVLQRIIRRTTPTMGLEIWLAAQGRAGRSTVGLPPGLLRAVSGSPRRP